MLGVRNVARAVWNSGWRRVTRQGPTSVAPYGSHVPILMALGRIIQPRTILELGSGFSSTPLFLDLRYFPSVERLTTIETDPSWMDQLRQEIEVHPRWDPQLIGTSMAQWLDDPEIKTRIQSYDLIFVDDSPTAELRSDSLDSLFRTAPSCPVCIHDVDLRQLRHHVWKHPKAVIYNAFLPQTGVCNVKQEPLLKLLRNAKNSMRPYRSKAAEPKSLEDWVGIGREMLESSRQ